MSKEIHKNSKKSSKLGSMLIKQIIAATVCFAVIYGMHGSDNMYLNNYAASIGRALRYDADFAQSAKSAAKWVKEQLLPEQSTPDTEGITFQ